MTGAPDDEGLEARGGDVPAVIYLPDQSQPEPSPPRPKPGRYTEKGKGRHFGPRPVKDPRDARFDVRCRVAFRAKLMAEAQAAGLSLSAYVCAKLGDGPGPRAHRNPGPDAAVLTKILAQMGWRGSSLNQEAKALNQIALAAPAERRDRLADLIDERRESNRAALADHRAVCEALKFALGVPPDADQY
jgi:hypothetical protein